ncbi:MULTISPECIES: hypothetical protein [Pantoea]|uniref:gp53-like domain-containing protein n=1 Tax=Pantoea TaxID=53335 RepID=UPI00069FD732|nr:MULTISPECIES: hypothetical protein [Pantoea]MDU2730529.1 hypothetical protein [Pantoea sp.]DAW17450.1 MAG TPA: tail fiber protein [Caudoviricetes sp.]
MHRIDTSTAQKDKFGVGKNGFTGGNPQTGELPTALDAPFFDSLQEELSAVIEAAGISLKKDDNAQLLQAIRGMITNLALGTASKRNVGTGTNQLPDMSSFTSTLNTPGVMRFPGGFTIMWALGGTDSAGVANTAMPASFPNACLGAIAIERNPYAWGQGQTSTFAVQINALTKTSVQALGRQISAGTVSATSGVGCLVLAWGY